jgi:hypothetical protein
MHRVASMWPFQFHNSEEDIGKDRRANAIEGQFPFSGNQRNSVKACQTVLWVQKSQNHWRAVSIALTLVLPETCPRLTHSPATSAREIR